MSIFRRNDRKIVEREEKEKIMIISSMEDMESLKNVGGTVHLTFRPSNMDIFKLIKSCPDMKVIEVPESYIGSISDSIKIFLNMQGIILRAGTIQRKN